VLANPITRNTTRHFRRAYHLTLDILVSLFRQQVTLYISLFAVDRVSAQINQQRERENSENSAPLVDGKVVVKLNSITSSSISSSNRPNQLEAEMLIQPQQVIGKCVPKNLKVLTGM
jgi:hypothetical protein